MEPRPITAQAYNSNVVPTKETAYYWIDTTGYHVYSAQVLSTPFATGTEENPYIIKGVIPTAETSVSKVKTAKYTNYFHEADNAAVVHYLWGTER
jgi:hypothetical protein